MIKEIFVILCMLGLSHSASIQKNDLETNKEYSLRYKNSEDKFVIKIKTDEQGISDIHIKRMKDPFVRQNEKNQKHNRHHHHTNKLKKHSDSSKLNKKPNIIGIEKNRTGINLSESVIRSLLGKR